MTLQQRLIRERKLKWLDIGCGDKYEPGFVYVDQLPVNKIPKKYRSKYTQLNLLKPTASKIKKLKKFDLIRMQHVFEHFSYEEGKKVLNLCAKLLKKNGVLIITTPDLKINVKKYTQKKYKEWKQFTWWAHKRIPKNSPDSFYFSIFAYSMPWQSHKWIYDYEGLRYQVRLTGFFRQIRELKKTSDLASIPFTHNRPEEDVCLMAVKK